MKILAIDYGTVRVGLALSYASLAQPLTILENNHQLIENILALLKQHQVKRIVVGVSENQMAKKTEDFVAHLTQATSLPIVTIDETLSSYQVRQNLHWQKKKKRGQPIDHLAAAIILENYLAQTNNR